MASMIDNLSDVSRVVETGSFGGAMVRAGKFDFAAGPEHFSVDSADTI